MSKKSNTKLLIAAVLAAIISFSCAVTACSADGFSVSFVVDDEIVDTVAVTDVANFEMPEDPVKTGYAFDGWYLDKDVWAQPFEKTYFTENELADNINVYAKWSLVNYGITYELNGGVNVENNPATYTVEDRVVFLPAEREGYTFLGWYVGDEKVTEIVRGSVGDLTLSAEWAVNTYSINYELNGGVNSESNPVGYNTESETIVLQPAEKTGYKFDGWYVGEQKITEIAKGSVGNLTLTAEWIIENYKLTYELNGGYFVEENPSEYNVESQTIVLKPAERHGYVFDGWFNGGEAVTEIKSGTTGNITLSARWIPEVYTVTYLLEGGNNSDENPTFYTVESETIVLQPAQKKNYIFEGWYNGDDPVTEIVAGSTGEITLTAKWVGNLGTEQAPYQISDAEEFKKISSGTADKINYYVLTDDIHFAESDFVSQYFVFTGVKEYVSVDGDGHSMSADAHMDSNDGVKHTFVFDYTGNEVTVENLNLKIDSYDGYFMLVCNAGRDDGKGNLTLRNVDVISSSDDVVVSGDFYNNAPYIYYPNSGRIDFVDCDNYVNFNSTLSDRYYAVYIGAYEYIRGMKISFTDCDNYGDVRGAGYVAMFVGNATSSSRENHAEYTVENCYNYGVIQGGKGAALFAVNISSAYFSELNERYTFEVNKGSIGKVELQNFTYTVNEDGYVEYSLGDASDVAEVELTLGVSVQYYNGDGVIVATGASVVKYRVPAESSHGVFDKYKVGKFIDKNTYGLLGINVELNESTLVSEYNGMSIYNIEFDGSVYYVVIGNEDLEIRVNENATVYVSAYGADGTVLGQAVKA